MSTGNFSVEGTPIAGLKAIRCRAFADDRGWFYESWREDAFAAMGIRGHFVQDNHSRSRRGVLRGLHWQDPPAAQGKLLRCTRGAVFDVALDIRAGSPTFGRHHSMKLRGDDAAPVLLWIPPGLAHGFLALEEDTEVQYRCTATWNRDAERCLRWDDSDLGIPWPGPRESIRVSEKDRQGASWKAYAAAPTFRAEAGA